jgi:hypothetical protein
MLRLGMVVPTCNLRYSGGANRKIVVWGWHESKLMQRPYLKNKLKSKRTGVVQMVES